MIGFFRIYNHIGFYFNLGKYLNQIHLEIRYNLSHKIWQMCLEFINPISIFIFGVSKLKLSITILDNKERVRFMKKWSLI